MKLHLLWVPALAALAFGVAACGDDDNNGVSADDVRTQVRDVATQIRQEAEDLRSSIDDELSQHDLSQIDDKTKQEWNQNCIQMTDNAKDEAIQDRLRDACGDLKKGLAENDDDAVREARDKIRDAAEQVDNG